MAPSEETQIALLVERVSELRTDVVEMRQESREAHECTVHVLEVHEEAIQHINLTLARNGINGGPKPVPAPAVAVPPAKPPGLTVQLSWRRVWAIGLVLVAILSGAVGFKVDWSAIGQAADVAGKLAVP